MALSTAFQTKQNGRVWIGTEATLGTAALATADSIEMPVTDYSFDEIHKHSLSVAPLELVVVHLHNLMIWLNGKDMIGCLILV